MILNDLIDIEEIGVRSIEPVNANTTLNNRTIASKITSQKWGFSITTSELTEVEFMSLLAEMSAQAGQYGEFQLTLLGTGNFNPEKAPVTVSANASVGASSVSIAAHGLPLPGTFIKFSGHTKIYIIRSATATALTIYPPLTTAVASGELGTIDQPTATVRNADAMSEMRMTGYNKAQKYDLTLEEVI